MRAPGLFFVRPCPSPSVAIRATLGAHFGAPWTPERQMPPLTDAAIRRAKPAAKAVRSEEHTSELQSLMRSSYAVFCLKIKNTRHARMKFRQKISLNKEQL